MKTGSLAVDPAPLCPGEWAVLCTLLAGDCHEAELLRAQVDSVRFASPWYEGPLRRRWFKSKRNIYIARSRFHIDFRIRAPQDFVCEDWVLGDRRQLLVDDVFCSVQGGATVRCTLSIEGGLVRRMSISEPDPNGFTDDRSLTTEFLDPHAVCYHNPMAPHQVAVHGRPSGGIRAIFGIPAVLNECSEWQQSIMALDGLRLATDLFLLPFSVRRARPATIEDIRELEQRYQMLVPNELFEFWLATNGMAILGATILGTYDTQFVDAPHHGLLLSTDAFGENTSLIISVAPKPARRAPFGSIRLFSPERDRQWPSLREFLFDYLSESRIPKAEISICR